MSGSSFFECESGRSARSVRTESRSQPQGSCRRADTTLTERYPKREPCLQLGLLGNSPFDRRACGMNRTSRPAGLKRGPGGTSLFLGSVQSFVEPRFNEGLSVDAAQFCLAVQHCQHMFWKVDVHPFQRRLFNLRFFHIKTE